MEQAASASIDSEQFQNSESINPLESNNPLTNPLIDPFTKKPYSKNVCEYLALKRGIEDFLKRVAKAGNRELYQKAEEMYLKLVWDDGPVPDSYDSSAASSLSNSKPTTKPTDSKLSGLNLKQLTPDQKRGLIRRGIANWIQQEHRKLLQANPANSAAQGEAPQEKAAHEKAAQEKFEKSSSRKIPNGMGNRRKKIAGSPKDPDQMEID